MKRNVLLGSMVFGLASVSCQSSKKSDVLDAMDERNDVSIFDATSLTYEELSKPERMSGKLAAKPWSDDYWPLVTAGIAKRWINTSEAQPLIHELEGEADDQYFTRTSAKIAEIQNGLATVEEEKIDYVSPAEKYDRIMGDSNFSLTMSELSSFQQNYFSYTSKEIDWGWMGHCHGWAPAAYLFEAPKYGVTTVKDGRKVHFTPGDIKALLTKASADYGFNNRSAFLSERCNRSDYSLYKDARDRIVDAVAGELDSSSHTKPLKIIHNNWMSFTELNTQEVAVIAKFGPQFQNSKHYWITATNWIDRQKEIVGTELYTVKINNVTGAFEKNYLVASTRRPQLIGCTINEIQTRSACSRVDSAKARWQAIWFEHRYADMRSFEKQQQGLQMLYQKGCRDTNAGTFHNILAQYLSDASEKDHHSFVLDITRDDQVWNHPVYEFESKMGEPTPLEIRDGANTYSDPFRTWRARGTRFIVDVYTRVLFGIENGPLVSYADEDDHLSQKVYHYTLELDWNKKVIGGEWHGEVQSERPWWSWGESWDFEKAKPRSGKELLINLKDIAKAFAQGDFTYYGSDSPDFMWVQNMGDKIVSGRHMDASIIERIHGCSLGQEVSGDVFEKVLNTNNGEKRYQSYMCEL